MEIKQGEKNLNNLIEPFRVLEKFEDILLVDENFVWRYS